MLWFLLYITNLIDSRQWPLSTTERAASEQAHTLLRSGACVTAATMSQPGTSRAWCKSLFAIGQQVK
eukprot:15645206-Heterocapsa_arctica.AAC.1